MIRSRPYCVLNDGVYPQPIGFRSSSSSSDIRFYGITTQNELLYLGSTLDGDISISDTGKTICVVYYEFDHLTPPAPVIQMILGKEAK